MDAMLQAHASIDLSLNVGCKTNLMMNLCGDQLFGRSSNSRAGVIKLFTAVIYTRRKVIYNGRFEHSLVRCLRNMPAYFFTVVNYSCKKFTSSGSDGLRS